MPSPLKSPLVKLSGSEPERLVLMGDLKPPSPVPKNTAEEPEFLPTAAKSKLPSPSKSPVVAPSAYPILEGLKTPC